MLRTCLSVCLFAVLAVFSSTLANAQTLDQRTIYPKKPEHLVARAGVNAADATLPATPIASALGVASLMAGFAESIGPKMRP